MQSTSKVLMVRPVRFSFNTETAGNNLFQEKMDDPQEAQTFALKEFENYVKLLQDAEVEVDIIDDIETPHTPDSIFPNNWFSTHSDGKLITYPVFAENRRQERDKEVLPYIESKYKIEKKIDLTHYENENEFLEGTGSMILDRVNRIVYACRSPRTTEEVLEKFCEESGYDYFLFTAKGDSGFEIYHTNVMMSVGSDLAIVCLDSIEDIEERMALIELLEENNREVMEITLEQMDNFAGNMLELQSKRGEPILVMSASAKKILNKEQLEQLQRRYKIIAPDLTHIENNGGGSARCMLAEIFLERK